mmetsp:Transcript_24917/g.98970  ORF Transcript_24917/g.98970 Transcript_24917/m.98970 type:complete len:225 (+) Transcript_24917:699-1373(+)
MSSRRRRQSTTTSAAGSERGEAVVRRGDAAAVGLVHPEGVDVGRRDGRSHRLELGVDVAAVARDVGVAELVVAVEEVAGGDHGGAVDAGEAVDRDGAVLADVAPDGALDRVVLLDDAVVAAREPPVHGVRDDLGRRATGRRVEDGAVLCGVGPVLVAVDDECDVRKDALARLRAQERRLVGEQERGLAPERQPRHDRVVRVPEPRGEVGVVPQLAHGGPRAVVE